MKFTNKKCKPFGNRMDVSDVKECVISFNIIIVVQLCCVYGKNLYAFEDNPL